MTRDQALGALGETTLRAVAAVLEAIPGIEPGAVSHVAQGAAPDSIPLPAVATQAAYVDGVPGGNVIVLTRAGAGKLAAALAGAEASEPEAELSEQELAAVGRCLTELVAAAAAATGAVLGTEVHTSAPTTTVLETEQESAALVDAGAQSTVSFSLFGEPCRLIQLVPNAFVVRLTRALADAASKATAPGGPATAGVAADSLRSVPVRVWAELGRTRLPIGRAVGLAPGTVVELDRTADEPVDLYVSGRHFGRGSLVVVEGEWAVEVTEVLEPEAPFEDFAGELA